MAKSFDEMGSQYVTNARFHSVLRRTQSTSAIMTPGPVADFRNFFYRVTFTSNGFPISQSLIPRNIGLVFFALLSYISFCLGALFFKVPFNCGIHIFIQKQARPIYGFALVLSHDDNSLWDDVYISFKPLREVQE